MRLKLSKFCFSICIIFNLLLGETQQENLNIDDIPLHDKPGQGTVCNQEYALCTSARCIPDPTDSNKTICFCTVHNGPSFGRTSCDERSPKNNPSGTRFLTSTYSFAEYDKKKTLYCPDGNAWSSCLDKKCTVDTTDPSKALCACTLMKSSKFLTLAGDCNVEACKAGFLSGAKIETTHEDMKVLVKELGLAGAPHNNCMPHKNNADL